MSTPYDPPQAPVADPRGAEFSLSKRLSWFYISIDGRIPRRQFWLLLLVPTFVGGGILQISLGYCIDAHILSSKAANGLWILAGVVVWWPAIAVQVKRWHDLDCSGWWVLVGAVPYVGLLVVLVANGLVRGTAGENRFGKDPLSTPDQGEEALDSST
jgi:uncharacterized membrane protein YhaH (DUF805 family)